VANFYSTITAAINDFAAHGYDSQERMDYWITKIQEAANASMIPESVLNMQLKKHLATIYEKLVDKKQMVKYHKGVSLFTLDQVKPYLRGELDKRILASADMIKLNRAQSIGRTIRRFQGWATSIPAGGSKAIDRMEEKAGLRKALASLPFEERRVIIDQGHKLNSAINDIIAKDGGAIGGFWHSHWRQAHYNYRKDHKERDGEFYLIRGCWAQQEGLVKVGPAGYMDEITQPGEEVFCRCWFEYVYSIEDLPAPMLTKKAKDRLAAIGA
jgi:hypothetical protein